MSKKISIGDRVTFLQHWNGEAHPFEGIIETLHQPPMTAIVRYKVPEHLQDGTERLNIIQGPIALFSLSLKLSVNASTLPTKKMTDAPVIDYVDKPESIDSSLLTRVLLYKAEQDLESFGGQDKKAAKFWIESRYKTIKGKQYGPYKIKRWRDENGRKRSQSLGKPQTVTPQ